MFCSECRKQQKSSGQMNQSFKMKSTEKKYLIYVQTGEIKIYGEMKGINDLKMVRLGERFLNF